MKYCISSSLHAVYTSSHRVREPQLDQQQGIHIPALHLLLCGEQRRAAVWEQSRASDNQGKPVKIAEPDNHHEGGGVAFYWVTRGQCLHGDAAKSHALCVFLLLLLLPSTFF